jgi:hypothetical protein
MKQASEFLLLFRFTPDFSSQPTQEELAEMQSQWGSFIGNVMMQEKLVFTHQLGFEGKQIHSDHSVNEGIVMDANQTLSGIMMVRANSIEEASEIGKNSPILHMGGTVEVRSITPMN